MVYPIVESYLGERLADARAGQKSPALPVREESDTRVLNISWALKTFRKPDSMSFNPLRSFFRANAVATVRIEVRRDMRSAENDKLSPELDARIRRGLTSLQEVGDTKGVKNLSREYYRRAHLQ